MAKIQTGKSIAQVLKYWQGLKGRMPGIVGVEAVNHFKATFRDGGFTDTGFVKWPDRKAGKDNEGRAILVKTGRLRRAIRILYQSNNRVMVGVSPDEVPYAAAHNNGFKGTVNVKAYMRRNRRGDTRGSKGVAGVRAHTMRMNLPQRQFIGESKVLNAKIESKINRELKNTLG